MTDPNQPETSKGVAPRWPNRRRVLAAVAAALALTIFLLLLQYRIFLVPTGSMMPTILPGERIVAEMNTLKTEDLKRGQVLIFESPYRPGVLYTDRVVGLPGEVLEIRDKQLFVNGEPLDEPYKVHESELDPEAGAIVREGGRIGPAEREAIKKRAWKRPFPIDPNQFDWGPLQIPEGAVLLLGDNRDNSKDGRVLGPVPMENLRGRALRIFWSSPPEHPLDIRWGRLGAGIQ